ncbi:hypothetical protein H2200_010251 [Cladophialophora chaetospira]|uniref:Uncharacterized protein n=1 Tax=Cladophialophora chaetospira TaxID=386627 RepID=A0AA38X2G1_9EURO|nr:hypothetical protein H2200_010251 [Cladophialophora chaetospira]
MLPWFQLPTEIRLRVYKYAFSGLVFKPLHRPNIELGANGRDQDPSPSFMSLAVSRRWKAEVEPYLIPSATFDFTAHPGTPPHIAFSQAYATMRHVAILETHCFNTDWLVQVFDKMVEVRTMTIRKLRRVGTVNAIGLDGLNVTDKFVEQVKKDPITTLLNGYRFDHVYVKQKLKSKWPRRRIFLEGSLWRDRDGKAHSASGF